MSRARGTNRIRLLGSPNELPPPTHATSAGTLEPAATMISWYTVISPRTTRLMARVMMSGWTRNTPTPMPFARPAAPHAPSARSTATSGPCEGTWVART